MRKIYFCKQQKGNIIRYPSILIITLFTVLSVSRAFSQVADDIVIITDSAKVKINPGTILSVYGDYINRGHFKNDGQVYFFGNWQNEGQFNYTLSEQGVTYFSGKEEQILDGSKPGFFRHIVFEHDSDSLVPFHLGTDFEIGGVAQFRKGIINAEDYGSKVLFTERATQEGAGNHSFINGPVLKAGISGFEFPIGSRYHYRPAYNDDSGYDEDNYGVHYFHKNSDTEYPHANKDKDVHWINNAEYWIVDKRDVGSGQMVLSLTLHPETTPSDIYNEIPGTKIGIVRWDAVESRWISEGGELDPSGELVMTPLNGYGLVTLGRITTAPDYSDDFMIYNGLTPNDDGNNDFFWIKGINDYPDNKVEIYNRWGSLVYRASGYNESDIVFRGIGTGSSMMGKKLVTGTYFYVIRYNKGGKYKTKTGYLFLN